MYNEHNNESNLRGHILRIELTHVKRLQWYLVGSKHLRNATYHNYSLSLFMAGHTAPWPSLPGWAGVVKLLLKDPASPGLCTCPSTPSLLTPFPGKTSIYPSSLNWNIISFGQTSLTSKVRLITLNIMFPWHLVFSHDKSHSSHVNVNNNCLSCLAMESRKVGGSPWSLGQQISWPQ